MPICVEFVLETKTVQLLRTSSTVFKRSNFQYGGKRGLGSSGKASSNRTKHSRPLLDVYLPQKKCLNVLSLNNVIVSDCLVNDDNI